MSKCLALRLLLISLLLVSSAARVAADATPPRDAPADPGCMTGPGSLKTDDIAACAQTATPSQWLFALELDVVVGLDRLTTGDVVGVGANVSTQSLVTIVSVELQERYRLGARVPLTIGSVRTALAAEQTLTALGNIQIEAEYRPVLTHALRPKLLLGLVVPTATANFGESGDAVHHVQNDVSLFALQRAASWSRGMQDGALFEAHRAGVVLELRFDYDSDSFRAGPFAKLESLVSTRADANERWLNTAVLGMQVGLLSGRPAEIRVRAWYGVPLSQHDEGFVGLEPSLSVRVADAQMALGAIWAWTGEPSLADYVGLRAVAGASF